MTPQAKRAAGRDPARRAAVDVVLAVDTNDAFGNLLLPRLLRERGLDSRDAALATELAYGALRRQGILDRVIERTAKRDVDSLDPPVRAVLRLGAYQLLHTRVPSHAAVSVSVDLTRDLCGPKPTGFVNAVLRRIATRSAEQWYADISERDGPLATVAARRGYPVWIAEVFNASLGGGMDELERALAPERPEVHLVARPGRISREALLRQAGEAGRAGELSPYAVHLDHGDPAELPAVRDGSAAVQDEGSQLVALALANAPLPGRDERWLDMCAGPGGKAALLAGLLPAGGRLLAAERQPHRARLVDGALGTDVSAATVIADSAAPAWPAATFDRVLLDAPCTGLGSLRRRPEARWRKAPGDARRLAALQRSLLEAAVTSTRPGGLIAYSTCSPHLCETVEVVSDVLRSSAGTVEELDVRALLPGVPDLGAGPHIQLWPHRHGTDAMFLSLLRRTGG